MASLHATLSAKDYRYARPGLEAEEWGQTVTVHDPFGNRLTFLQPAAAPSRVSDELSPVKTWVPLLPIGRSRGSPRSPGGATTASIRLDGW